MQVIQAATEPVNFLSEIANFIFTSKYARYNEKEGRRETWEECVARVHKMHHDKFKNHLLKDELKELEWAFSLVKDKRVVPSMRSLQFGGKAIEVANARIFNCSVRHIDSIRAFSESFYLFLCGVGIGFGISDRFLDRLPDLVGPRDKNGTVVTYVVQDSIEGWADSVEAILLCYFKNTAYSGRKVIFDYSKVRAEGAPIKTGGGKAPGYKGLKKCHQRIKALLDYIIEDLHQSRLKTINAYDILMHTADATLSGGIRRCLPEYYSIQMEDKTWKPIATVKPGESIFFNGRSYSITNVYNNGIQNLLKINTPIGYHVSTPNHKWLIYNTDLKILEWVEAQDIIPSKHKFVQQKE